MRRLPMRRTSILALALTLSALGAQSNAALVQWIAPAAGNWTTGANWSTGNPPAAGDDIENVSGTAITLNTNASLNSLTTGGAFTANNLLSGSQLDSASQFEFTGGLTVNSGGLINFTYLGGATVTTTFTGNGNNFIEDLILTGEHALSGGFARVFGENRIEGETTLSGLQLQFQNESSLTVTSTGSLTGNGHFSRTNGNSSFFNEGMVTADGGDLFLDTQANSGGGGTYQANADSRIIFRGNLIGDGATVQHADGEIVVDSGALAGSFAKLEVNFTGNGNNLISAVSTSGPGALGGTFTQAFDASSLGGTTTITGLQVHMQDGSSLTVESGASLTGTGNVSRTNDNSSLINNGSVRASGGDFFIDPRGASGGSGSYSAALGSRLIIRGNLTGDDATVEHDEGQILVDAGSLLGSFDRLEADFTGNGNNLFSGLTVTSGFAIGGTFVRAFDTSVVNGDSSIAGTQVQQQNASVFRVASGGTLSGTGNFSRTNDNSTFTNNGTVTATGGDLFIDPRGTSGGTGTYEASTGARLILRGNLAGNGATLQHNDGEVLVDSGALSGTFAKLESNFTGNGNNIFTGISVAGTAALAGSFVRAAGDSSLNGTSTISGLQVQMLNESTFSIGADGSLSGTGNFSRVNDVSTFTNDGTVTAEGGDLFIDPRGTSGGSGTYQAAEDSRLILRGNLAGSNATVQHGEGEFVVDAGFISGSFDKFEANFTGNGNNLISAITVDGPAALGGSFTRAFGANSFNGASTIADVNIQTQDFSSITIGADGSLTGFGLINRTSSDTAFTNNGEVKASGGTLFIDPFNTTNAGTFEAAAGARLYLRGDAVQTGGTTRVIGEIQDDNVYQVQGGLVEGTGTFTGSINNTGGTVAPGLSAGTLTVTGNATFGEDATLAVEIKDLSEFDLLSVGGAVSLDGTLTVAELPGAFWEVGDVFRIVTAGSRLGTFSVEPDPSWWTVVYGSNYVDLVATQAVPEPATLAVLGLGALVLRRRRRAM
jgi:hypothetical protein